jgi:hypothetical protein
MKLSKLSLKILISSFYCPSCNFAGSRPGLYSRSRLFLHTDNKKVMKQFPLKFQFKLLSIYDFDIVICASGCMDQRS